MTATHNKVTRAIIPATRVNKAGKKVNPEHIAATWESRVSKVVPAVAGRKSSKEICQIAEFSKVKKEESLPERVLLH
jgi:hypothetical protein